VERLEEAAEDALGASFSVGQQESTSALLITLMTSNKIVLRHDDEHLTEPNEIGRAVRNETNLTDVQIRFESLERIDPDLVRNELKR